MDGFFCQKHPKYGELLPENVAVTKNSPSIFLETDKESFNSIESWLS